jgi:hypothetical protein
MNNTINAIHDLMGRKIEVFTRNNVDLKGTVTGMSGGDLPFIMLHSEHTQRNRIIPWTSINHINILEE